MTEGTSRTAIDCFHLGLHRDIAQFLVGRKFDTLEKAIAAAGEAERHVMQRRELHGGRQAHYDSREDRRMFVRNIVASHLAPNGNLHPPTPPELKEETQAEVLENSILMEEGTLGEELEGSILVEKDISEEGLAQASEFDDDANFYQAFIVTRADFLCASSVCDDEFCGDVEATDSEENEIRLVSDNDTRSDDV
ncbi:hypothetical protein QAD02_013535 [Eretmocerus hayati]|uniref:Uncharacterized protein n=1 Tax=Eretmocerus hayati TaxID=131215 RepID=A0ACC2P3S3_9HYME|nr:hypothetical protein QAD02_013535 [Eretmocerus hayati]